RRRHTRSYGDWSSDVCSSDLGPTRGGGPGGGRVAGAPGHRPGPRTRRPPAAGRGGDAPGRALGVRLRRGEGEPDRAGGGGRGGRSEERRVGKEYRGRRRRDRV